MTLIKVTRAFFIFLFLYFLPYYVYGQSNYIDKDSTRSYGIKLIDGTEWQNSKFCQVKKGNVIIQYSPFELNEYGFEDGRIYVSKNIQVTDTSTRRVFLQLLAKGETTLYYLNDGNIKIYFLERDSTFFITLPKTDKTNNDIIFHDMLIKITSDCQNVSEATKLATYNKKSLTKLINIYNSCDLRPFPFLKYGLIIAFEASKISFSSNSEFKYSDKFKYKYDPGLTFGFFIDNPILMTDLSLHTELSFSRNRFSYNFTDENNDIDLVINTIGINIPISIRYSYPIIKVRPFFNFGGLYTYNIRNENILYEATLNGNVINIKQLNEEPILPKSQIGYSVGAGFQYKIDYRKHASIELRYDKQYGIPVSGSVNEAFHIVSSINF